MSKKHLFVTEVEVNERIDKLLVQNNRSYSRTQVQSWITNGLVAVNNKKVKPNYRCQLGDEVTWSIEREKKITIQPENIPLDIIYEDAHLIIVNKPKGMVIHPTAAHPHGTLVNALLYHGKSLSNISGEERPGIVHRIDKDTSGLIVVAKNNQTHEDLVNQFSNGTCERTYEAIVHGVIDHETGMIDAPIARDPSIRTKMAVVTGGREAITHFRVKKRYDGYTYIQCELQTGRTHQIRVHMNYIGHSVVGDPIYIDQKTLNVDGQALFAKALGFIHPHTKQKVRFKIDKPTYFRKILESLNELDRR